MKLISGVPWCRCFIFCHFKILVYHPFDCIQGGNVLRLYPIIGTQPVRLKPNNHLLFWPRLKDKYPNKKKYPSEEKKNILSSNWAIWFHFWPKKSSIMEHQEKASEVYTSTMAVSIAMKLWEQLDDYKN